MPTTHAKLSASSAHRWMHCPGSVALSELFPEARSSVYAAEGTLAHEMAEAMIQGAGDKRDDVAKHAAEFYADNPELGGSAEDMARTLTPYAEFVLELFAEAKKQDAGAVLLTEQRVEFDDIVPGGFGTADVVIIAGSRLQIIDLKYGKGVRVDAEDNPQLMLYAIGALNRFDCVYDIKDITVTIYQPRLDHISSETYYAESTREWGAFEVKPAAEEAAKDGGSAEFAAGAWCKFCPARYDCKERAAHNMRLQAYAEKTTLTAEETAEILKGIDELVAFAEDIKARALERALAGEEIDGYKVVEGRSVRRYSAPEADIVAACKAAGYDEALLYERKLATITAMEKLLGKKGFAEILGGMIEKPAGKPTLAPISDKRPAITGTAADDFADE